MMRLKEKDYGTPIVQSEKTVTGYVDGIEVTVPEGTSIMRAASMVDIDIPSLCASDNMNHFGSCRLCIVDFEGRSGFGYPSSCNNPLTDGMKVVTKILSCPSLERFIEMYISDHPLDCNTCSGDGDCDLQDQAKGHDLFEDNKLTQSKYSFDNGCNHLGSDAIKAIRILILILIRHCMLQMRQACNEVQGTFALSIESRGFESSAGISDNFFDSECFRACVQACPTGSLIEKSVEEKGMPNETVLTTCAYCGVGCSFKAEIKDKEVVRMIKVGSAIMCLVVSKEDSHGVMQTIKTE